MEVFLFHSMAALEGIPEKERTALVHRLLAILKEKFGDDLLFFGLKGSMARGDYTPLSDIDAVAIIKNGTSKSKEWYYKDISVDLEVLIFSDAKKRVTDLSGGWWPYTVGGLLEPKIIFEKGNTLQKLHKAVEILRKTPEKFLEQCITGGYYEYYSKAVRDYYDKNFFMLRYDAWELFFMACIDLGLINQQYYTVHGPNMLNQLDRMTFLPQDFKEMAQLCFDDNPEQVFKGCIYIFEETKRWQHTFGYNQLPHNTRLQHIDDITL